MEKKMKTAKDYLEEANAVVKKIDVAEAIEKQIRFNYFYRCKR